MKAGNFPIQAGPKHLEELNNTVVENLESEMASLENDQSNQDEQSSILLKEIINANIPQSKKEELFIRLLIGESRYTIIRFNAENSFSNILPRIHDKLTMIKQSFSSSGNDAYE